MDTFVLEERISREQVLIVDSALNYTESVHWTEAISDVVSGKANILIPRNDGAMIRSAYLTYPHPLVVSLKAYVGVRTRVMSPNDPVSRRMILVRDNWTCYVCKGFGDTMEHIYPESRGGESTWSNLAVACKRCNGLKADRTPEEMGWERPVIPSIYVDRRREEIQSAIYTRLTEMAAPAE